MRYQLTALCIVKNWTNRAELSQPCKVNVNTQYTYDEKGIRTSKTVNGKTTYYTTVDGTIISQYELDEQGEVINEMVFLYDSQENLIGFTYGGNTYFYIKNHMNDVMGIGGKDKLKLECFFWKRFLRIFLKYLLRKQYSEYYHYSFTWFGIL